MQQFLLDHEPMVRLGVFAGLLTALALAEAVFPRRARRQRRGWRWPVNLALVALGTLALRLVIPVVAVSAALWAEAAGWGLLRWLGLADGAAFAIAVLALDLAIYGQHVAMHRLPWLWRVHRVHHADLDLDVTSGLRFHPMEFVLSMFYKVAVVVALGAPAAAVVVFEVVLNALALFNHANLRLPAAVDRILRRVIVTPDVHVVHHSTLGCETDSNFGFNLIVWDRLFGTYRARPAAGPVAVTLGLPECQQSHQVTLPRLLAAPLRGLGGAPSTTAMAKPAPEGEPDAP
ncbi:sterol desaturase/sphingolipid hydroxylase (fatty acid hydroxylase superfamily) [Rhodothalassium salexigens DSM 2132]|uniref:Sterol desaturase/sphingolipid hydroxylase (Fatty acid hydroxylase superfamily) n=1 Tax=Rhodothalassium salexigens DSM 2132 TaxID=1188247 RepID=A0A4R2PH95_RHOSA|nr:sterol desaturase family protein [Rhodothalassium salexigens]MBB4211885.1 sterol desaturase/sphingolipid hydroxylase (fatty acid hydroxylase superfamily) [Rhodothalassium salexigens DSM 2132]MBK1638926.1 sterol desaturase [Rhodothalassium salexigens DSM 2132]TCP33531.1 sterol desaturase/sphingolipid hydroxylase (fatty acid hydroxylase superfamily) [Rhodothalassium salexigens DSM 2132]